jgi:hypothetical protein
MKYIYIYRLSNNSLRQAIVPWATPEVNADIYIYHHRRLELPLCVWVRLLLECDDITAIDSTCSLQGHSSTAKLDHRPNPPLRTVPLLISLETYMHKCYNSMVCL